MLAEMGVGPVWTARHASAPGVDARVDQLAGGEVDSIAGPAHAAVATAEVAAGSVAGFAAEVATDYATVAVSRQASPAGLDWAALQQAVAGCTACGLCSTRKNTVFGVGDRKASWLFVGEGPGRQEDLQGEPFVGPAGQLLDNMLKALGLQRGGNAYIANIVKCRPAAADGRDRPPSEEEIAACLPFLERQVELLQPTVIVALGKVAAVSLLGLPADTPVGSLRGTLHSYRDRPLVVTYHPAYLLRQPADKAKAWRDLCMALTAHAAAG